MICQSCGHDYPSALTRCNGCGQLTPHRMRSVGQSSQSRLIEFPRQPRRDAERDSPQPAVPSWRAEVSERVRAVKAKRIAEGSALQSAQTTQLAQTMSLQTAREDGAASMSSSLKRSNNPLVEAALTRVRRAADNGISPSHSVTRTSSRSFAGPGVSSDKDATARALVPEPEIVDDKDLKPLPSRAKPILRNPESRIAGGPLPARTHSLTGTAKAGEGMNPVIRGKAPVAAPAATQLAVEYAAADPIDEIEPRDYLADEIKRVDKVLSRSAGESEAAPALAQIVASCVDLLVMGLASTPFLALIELNNGVYSERSTKIAGFMLIGLVSFFYLALTHCARGRTFGMMLTGTRVVTSGSNQPLTISKVFLRTIGYYIAAAPVGIGLVWVLFDGRRRGWPDLISGAVVIKDA